MDLSVVFTAITRALSRPHYSYVLVTLHWLT